MSLSRFPYPGFDRAWTAGPTFLMGLALVILGLVRWSTLPTSGIVVCFSIGMPLAVMGAALWCEQSWARIPGVGLFGALALYFGWLLATSGWSWKTCGGLLFALWMMWEVWKDFSPRSYAAEEEAAQAAVADRPLISLVLLLRRPRHLDARILARYCSTAWGGTFTATEGELSAMPESATDGSVAGRPPLLIVAFNNRLHLIHNHDQPYFDEPASIANATGDLRIRQLLAENRGWMAVDLICARDETVDPNDHYPRLALLIAELAGPDCQAIYQPDEGRFNHWDESLEAKLRLGGLSAVFSENVRLPVIEVSDEDPRMKAAVTEARSRWEEFETAFRSGTASHYSVKAPITIEDQTEFIWITVDAIQGEEISGKLGNDPVNLGNLKMGTSVVVTRSEVTDWVYMRDDMPTGLFSLKALGEIQRERSGDS